MLTQVQNAIIYLMVMNGILFLGLNFIAYSLVFPGPKGSKRIGYLFIVSALLAYLAQQEYRTLLSLDFSPDATQRILLGGCIVPVFLISAVYYRIKKHGLDKEKRTSNLTDKEKDAVD